ncbi:MAG: DEAD/DEAH box helicase, partial [Inhella sp.]
YLRKAVASGLQRAPLQELIPPHLVKPGLPTLREALQALHHPPPHASLAALEDRSTPAWQRLKWEELLAQQLSQLMARRERAQRRAPILLAKSGGLPEQLLAALPFELTAAQRRVVEEIAQDLARAEPMHRLLQGDVGSGKTVVAALAAAVAIEAGWQCALMAPTEILAEQHFRKLVGWLQPLLEARGQTVAWLTGSIKGKSRKAMLEATADGRAALVVGTQAVIQDTVQFARLGLALIDEQHRFGVAQRLALRKKLEGSGITLEPHLLMMTATPIPRTLAMSYYADLSVSTIDELPPGRTPIVTKVFADNRRDAVIEHIREEVARGRQVYWVCPLIEESEALDL